MLGLRGKEEKYHEKLGQSLANLNFELAILVGPLSGVVINGAVKAGIDRGKLIGFADSQAVVSEIANLLKHGDLVYIKGSRGIALEKIIDVLGAKKGNG